MQSDLLEWDKGSSEREGGGGATSNMILTNSLTLTVNRQLNAMPTCQVYLSYNVCSYVDRVALI